MAYFLSFDTNKLPESRAEAVVCGSGIAGLTTAIVLKELGVEPVILTRGIGNTYYSQGGIACASHPEDSPYMHFLDTQRAGRGLCREDSLRVLVEEGVQRLADLTRWGVNFDPETTIEGGHSFPRVYKVKDYTGRAIYQALWNRVKQLNIKVLTGEVQEILGEERVQGVLYYDGGLKLLKTNVLVLATGGAASMFLHTSNPVRVRGDAIGMALRKDVALINAEFVQFHPTVVKNTSILISEAARGEGAVLVDQKGERFVDELQPRDVVARAIYNKIKNGESVFLDFRPIRKKGIELSERFPTIHAMLRERGYDPDMEPIPITPASHYYIGGLDVDLYGRTTLSGLYAVGECACTGVHGANRLASNSLLEGVVFGYRTAYRVFHDLNYHKNTQERGFKNAREGELDPPYTFEELRTLMWHSCGLERREEDLKDALKRIQSWLECWQRWKPTVENRQLFDITLVAMATLSCALRRKESRGVHYRTDFPYEREEFKRDSVYGLEVSMLRA
ncbi:MAG: FAD-binding protein [Aquificaceae bacterium]|nr:FAD-binding protein [Aquificaceae bacterium]MDW8096312.1 FAD-binding protein [Aquificaceae bacterium]